MLMNGAAVDCNGAQPIDSNDLRKDVAEGLFYTHARLSQNTNKTLEASSFLYGLIELLNERSRCAIEIGKIKKKQNLRVHDPDREREVLKRVKEANNGPLNGERLQRLFECIMDECRQVEGIEHEKGKKE